MAKNKDVKDVEVEEIEETEEVEEVKTKVVDNDDYEEISLEDRIINIEKRTNITLGLVVTTLIITIIVLFLTINVVNSGLTGGSGNSGDTLEVEDDFSYDTSAFDPIKASEIKSESKGETIVVLIARQGCSYCSYFAPIITEVAKDYDVTVRYIDLTTIIDFSTTPATITDTDSFDTLQNLTGEGEWETFAADNLGGTPLTLIIKNNKVVGGIGGYTEAENVSTAFKNAGLKK